MSPPGDQNTGDEEGKQSERQASGGNMETVRTGIILNVERFDECVAFYRNLFDLRIMFEERHGDFRLACLEFGGSYLMIETGGIGKPEGKTISECPMKLRFNVLNMEEALKAINRYGIEAEIEKNEWGSTINTIDPDGNRIGIRDDPTFQSQIET